ncbi:MAG: hypothetical protein ACYTFX_01775 [Planctomycetota bacterium]|jgi:hypothetical protein
MCNRNKRLYKNHLYSVWAVAVFAVMLGALTSPTFAYPKGANPHAQFLGGPYELLVQRGMQGAEMVFPVKVDNENVPGNLDAVFPVMGSSAKIKLEQFLPELVWEQYTEKAEKGGTVIKLKAVGPDLDQVFWLCAKDKEKQGVSSTIGGMAIKSLKPNADIKKIAAELADPNAVGILSVFHKDPNEPNVYVVKKDGEIQVYDSPYQFKVLEYMPHYSVDTATRKIANASEEPKNPAIRVRFTDGDNPVEQWLFSRFTSHPHMPNKIPTRVEFTDFDLGTNSGNYIVIDSGDGQLQVLLHRDGRKHAEPVKLNTPYPLAGEGYSLILQEIFSDVVLKQRWKNNRDQLLNPAIIAMVDEGDRKEQVVLELNKPQHIRSESETMVLLFRRKVQPVEHLK